MAAAAALVEPQERLVPSIKDGMAMLAAEAEPVNLKWVYQRELDIWRVQTREGERYKILAQPSRHALDWWVRFLRDADTSRVRFVPSWNPGHES